MNEQVILKTKKSIVCIPIQISEYNLRLFLLRN